MMRTLTKIILMSTAVAFIAVKWRPSHFDPESLRGARVLVTGASTGIGEQLAYHYARFGAQIVITARRANVLQQVVEKCLSLGAQKALYIAADMATESDPDKVVEFSLEKLGGLDYLVLNHIGPTPVSMWKGDIEHARWLMKVNFFSYVQMAWKALPSLEQSKGSLQELAMKNSTVSVSICTLGLIDTETAMTAIKGIVTNVPASPASEAALNIIETGATRQAELYYPWKMFIMTIIKDWSSTVTNYLIRSTYKYDP